jgi:hypothetical protein
LISCYKALRAASLQTKTTSAPENPFVFSTSYAISIY